MAAYKPCKNRTNPRTVLIINASLRPVPWISHLPVQCIPTYCKLLHSNATTVGVSVDEIGGIDHVRTFKQVWRFPTQGLLQLSKGRLAVPAVSEMSVADVSSGVDSCCSEAVSRRSCSCSDAKTRSNGLIFLHAASQLAHCGRSDLCQSGDDSRKAYIGVLALDLLAGI